MTPGIAKKGLGLPQDARFRSGRVRVAPHDETCGKTQSTSYAENYTSGVIRIEVRGVPAPKGSNRAIARGGRAMLVPGSSDSGRLRMDAWAAAVRGAALDACSVTIAGPVEVAIEFRLARPRGHLDRAGAVRSSAPRRPAVKPDIDKLARSTLDALTGVAFDDDARIVALELHKAYADDSSDQGARISVRAWRG